MLEIYSRVRYNADTYHIMLRKGARNKEVNIMNHKVFGWRRMAAAALAFALAFVFAAPVWADETAEKWQCEKRSGVFEGYGGWKEAVRAYTSGKCTDKMSCHTTKKVNSTYSGELKVSIPKLESFALMKHKINKSFSVSVKYATSLKGKKKGTWAIQYRQVYNCRNITQRKYRKVDKTWKKTSVTKKVKTKDYKSIAYRVVYLSPKNKTGV